MVRIRPRSQKNHKPVQHMTRAELENEVFEWRERDAQARAADLRKSTPALGPHGLAISEAIRTRYSTLYSSTRKVAVALYNANGDRLTYDALAATAGLNVERGGHNSAKVHVSLLRIAMGVDCIDTRHGYGYSMTVKGRQIIDDLLQQSVQEKPDAE